MYFAKAMLQKHTQVRNLTLMWNAVMMIASWTIKFYWNKENLRDLIAATGLVILLKLD